MTEIQKFSYHCHTVFSDGKNSIREMIQQAKKIGFTELGISDHMIVHKNIYQSVTWPYLEKNGSLHVYNRDFSEILERAKLHCDEIRKIAKQENFNVLIGFEVDYFTYSGWEEELRWCLKQLDYDYLHSGNHFFCDETCENVINMNYLKKVCDDKAMYHTYTAKHLDILKQAVESGLFDFLAHIDYVRKYGEDVYNYDDFSAQISAVLTALENTGTGIEISTKGLRKYIDFYPEAKILQKIAAMNIPVVISDDAHRIEELGADFDKAEAQLQKFGITKRLKF